MLNPNGKKKKRKKGNLSPYYQKENVPRCSAA
jgi:hypothetical protein